MNGAALTLVVLLAGCSSAEMRREVDVTGTLPRAIALGAFAPSCVVLCFVTTHTTQGDAIEPAPVAAPITLHQRATSRSKGKR